MRYKVELIKSDDGYTIGCPELPGCWSQGRTEEEAISNIQGAIREYRSVQPNHGTSSAVMFVEVPEPSTGEDSSHVSKAHVPFEVKPFPMGMPPGGSYDKIEDLLDLLEGPYRR
jgi:predicted RNase H-like HicB family nuclease